MDYEYREIIEQIENRRRFGNACGRDVTREFLKRLGHPEKGMKILHIAGTNGKGSTAAFLDQILREAGVKVGMFTSPHLVTFRERIKVGGEMIPEADAARIGKVLLEESMPQELTPTFFDLCLAMAILYFREQACELVILETGLGGRLDSTRGVEVTPLVSVVTAIGLDHTSVLGNTLEEIAGEKAGILRRGTRAVLADMAEEAAGVLVEACQELDVPWIQMKKKKEAKNTPSPYPIVTMIQKVLNRDPGVILGLHGEYQWENGANALGALYQLCQALPQEGEDLSRQDLLERLTEEVIREGLAKTRWPGRMQVLRKHPLFVIDGAHNPQGVKALAKTLRDRYPDKKFHFFTGVLSDKDYRNMMREMLPLAASFDTVSVDNLRTLDGEELAKMIRSHGVKAYYHDNIEKAVKRVWSYKEDETAGVVAFGSLYFVGEVLGISKRLLTIR